MSVPFDDFCTQALERAQAKSVEIENGFIGTEHILWGILEAQGDLYAVLKEQNVDIESLLKNLEPSMTDYSGLSKEKGPKTPRLRKILMDAQHLALQMMETRIDEKILLRTLLTAGKNSAVRAIESMELDCSKLIEEIESRQKKQLKEQVSWLIQDNKPLAGQPIPRQFFPNLGQIVPPVQSGQTDGQIHARPPAEPASPEKPGFGRDLSALALSRKLGPVIGRDGEIEEICLCLRRARSHNPVLVGEKGVGKTSVVEGLALRMAQGDIPGHLKHTKILEVSGAKFFQALGSSQKMEEKFKSFIQNSPFPGNIIFLDGVIDVLNEERIPWSVVNSVNFIKEQIEEGNIRIIIATTQAVFEKRILSDPLFSKQCQRIAVEELPQNQVLDVLKAIKPRFEGHHQVQIPDEILSMTVELAVEYLKDDFLPGKALDLLDEACALAGMHRSHDGENRVAESLLISAAAKRSGLPLEKISRKADKFKHMEEEIRKKLVGQDEAVEVVCDRIKLFMTGLHEENRPLGVLFFAGPTGVGKTELARVVASYLFGSDAHFHRFDMSEYSQPHEVSRLVGAPPGYVGFEEEGQLTGRVKGDPYCVILLDEVEKAHPRVFDTFLQVFDAGRLTDGKGNTVDFRNTLIIMTSNMGANLWKDERALGFRQKDGEQKRADKKEKMTEQLKEQFSPEFVNRINEVVIFNALGEENIRAITLLVLEDWKEKTKKHGVHLSVEESLVVHLSREGYSKDFGVRNLKRVIENILIVPLSKKILEGAFTEGNKVCAGFTGSEIELRKLEE